MEKKDDMGSWWYRQQVLGLYLILDDCGEKDIMITREYVREKLKMILDKQGINFHPEIRRMVEKDMQEAIESI